MLSTMCTILLENASLDLLYGTRIFKWENLGSSAPQNLGLTGLIFICCSLKNTIFEVQS